MDFKLAAARGETNLRTPARRLNSVLGGPMNTPQNGVYYEKYPRVAQTYNDDDDYAEDSYDGDRVGRLAQQSAPARRHAFIAVSRGGVHRHRVLSFGEPARTEAVGECGGHSRLGAMG